MQAVHEAFVREEGIRRERARESRNGILSTVRKRAEKMGGFKGIVRIAEARYGDGYWEHIEDGILDVSPNATALWYAVRGACPLDLLRNVEFRVLYGPERQVYESPVCVSVFYVAGDEIRRQDTYESTVEVSKDTLVFVQCVLDIALEPPVCMQFRYGEFSDWAEVDESGLVDGARMVEL